LGQVQAAASASTEPLYTFVLAQDGTPAVYDEALAAATL
jgi:hypothetical protein